jgi:N-acetylglucosamine malate deacetylase 1
MLSGKRILVLCPHTDDGELGCGGTIHKLLSDNEVYYAAFSSCQHSVPDGFAADVLVNEMQAATRILGVKKESLFLFDYEVRTFSSRRQEILDELIKLKKDIAPHLVFMPSINDVHQDHSVITNEGIRAFKYSSILCYELPWNNFSFITSCFVSLTEENVQTKCEAIAAYHSQKSRPYANQEFIRSLAKVRGVQAGSTYAEAFEVIRWLI